MDWDVALHVAFNEHNDLTGEAYQALDKLAMVMTNELSVKIALKGYSRGLGSVDYHKKMSEFGANIVKGYLVGKGVSASRIETMGMMLGVPEDTADGQKEEQTWVEILLEGGQ